MNKQTIVLYLHVHVHNVHVGLFEEIQIEDYGKKRRDKRVFCLFIMSYSGFVCD